MLPMQSRRFVPLSHRPTMSISSPQPRAGPSHVASPYAQSDTNALSDLVDRLSVISEPDQESAHGPSTDAQLALKLYAEELELSTLTAQLALEDIAELQGQQKGKGREGTPASDAALALELCAEEAQLCIGFQNDHLLALKTHVDENGTSLLADEITVPQTTVKPDPPRPNNTRCVICRDPIHGVNIHTPCGHDYDVGCIADLFATCTRDESLYPPRCCQQLIPLLSVREHFGEDLLSLFVQKSREFEMQKRVYCARQDCSSFVGAEHSDGLAAPVALPCSAAGCDTLTCSRCKSQVNRTGTHICVVDPSASDRAALDLARESGWSQCPGCSRLIELNTGCYHITCLCKADFCYLCRARWKSCTCPQWEERLLYAAAEQRVDRMLGGVRAPEPALRVEALRADPQPRPQVRAHVAERRERLIRDAVDDLRYNHECGHNKWAFRNGGGQCESCFHTLPQYLFRCRGCQMLACNRCRRNRL